MSNSYNWKTDKILLLIGVFDGNESSLRQIRSEEQAREWRPNTEAEQKAFEELTSKENRELLKAWYLNITSINPTADRFRRILERAIGEEIPLAKK